MPCQPSFPCRQGKCSGEAAKLIPGRCSVENDIQAPVAKLIGGGLPSLSVREIKIQRQ